MFTEIKSIESRFNIIKQLGCGLHSTVHSGVNLEDNKIYAVKISRKAITRRRKEETKEIFSHEIAILREVDHTNIIRIHQAFSWPNYFCMTLDLLEGGELFDYFAKISIINEEESKNFARQILNALDYIHDRNIAHFDIKPENIVLEKIGSKLIKLIDFSLSCTICDSDPIMKLGGTVEFMAPEAINFEPIGTSTDMWSFGVLLYYLVTGFSPFLDDTVEETQNNILTRNLSYEIDEFKTISPEVIDLIEKLLVLEKSGRIKAKDSLNHNWFKEKEAEHEPDIIKINDIPRRRCTISTTGFKLFQERDKLFLVPNLVVKLRRSLSEKQNSFSL